MTSKAEMAPTVVAQPLPQPVDPASARGLQLTRELAENHAAIRARLAREAALDATPAAASTG